MKRSNSSMVGSKHRRMGLGVVAGLLGLLCWLGGGGDAFAAGTFVVDGADPGCSDTAPGAGTEGNPPYCSISAAAAARGGPGTTILVKPAIYREQVTVQASGAEGSPFLFQALGPGVVLDGADDFASAALWEPHPTNAAVWLAVAITEDPFQVFVDGARLTRSSAEPAVLAPGTFRHVRGEGLYVNLGGGNPGTHQTLVGARLYGFYLYQRAFVTIDGFTVTRIKDRAIYVRPSCSNIAITHNTATFAGRVGIQVEASSNVLIGANVVSDNNADGVNLTEGTTGSTVQDNEVFRNRNHGVRLYRAPENLLQRNNVHDNSGTGIAILGTELHDSAGAVIARVGSDNTLSLQNRSWRNGAHGFTHFLSTGTNHVGDVPYGNFRHGFSVEGKATDTRIFNSIGVNNGVTGGQGYSLLVDSTSAPGFVSDYNIFWNSTSQAPVRYSNTTYATLAAFTAATGQDANSTQADPRFVAPAGGDFRLQAGSPAIDAADSSVANWPATDAAGNARADDPATANRGAGPVPYADRGALEFLPFGLPVGALTVTPASGEAPLTVLLDASASTDPDGGTLVSYLFAFGDGTTVGPQPDPTATHTYAAGTFTATVTVTDNEGASASASQVITVNALNLVANPSFESDTSGWGAYGSSTIQRVAEGQEGVFSLEVRGPASTATFGINDSPNWVATTGAAGTRYRFSAWVRSEVSTGRARIRVREYLNGVLVGTATYSPFVPLTSAWQLLLTDHVAQAAGSTLDVQVLDYPVAPGEVFQTDNTSIRVVP